MKSNLIFLPALIASLWLTLTGCNKKPEAEQAGSPSTTPAKAGSGSGQAGIATRPPFEGGRKTSFQEVATELDPGGSLFLYLATAQWLSTLSTNISAFREAMLSLPGMGMPNKGEIQHAFDLIARLVQASGIQDVTGVGASAAPIAPGLYRNKLILHHPSGAGQGFLWSMFGRAPHPLHGQDLLPANTALAGFADLDIAQLWEIIEQELKQSGIPGAAEAARSFPQMFEKQTQMAWKPLLDSLGGEIGLVLTLDETQQVSIPAGREKVIEIPAPALLLAIKVKSDLLYNQISAKLRANPNTVTSDEGGLKLCTMPLPLPLPIRLEPTVASSGDYFYMATSPALVRTVQAVRQDKSPGAKSSPEFLALAKLLPAEGNQFVYIAKKFGQTLSELQTQAIRESGMPEDKMTVLRQLFGATGPAYSLSVGAHTSTGWHTTSVGNQDSSSAVMLAPVAGLGIAAGMVLPALAKAKSKAQTIGNVNQLKQLGLAARMYSNDHKDKYPDAKTWADDIKEYVGNPNVYKSPNDSGPGECSYAYNEKLSGMEEGKIDPQTVLFFEAEGGWNRSGGPELMLSRPRSGNSYVIGFADGSVQQMSPGRIRSLRWNP